MLPQQQQQRQWQRNVSVGRNLFFFLYPKQVLWVDVKAGLRRDATAKQRRSAALTMPAYIHFTQAKERESLLRERTQDERKAGNRTNRHCQSCERKREWAYVKSFTCALSLCLSAVRLRCSVCEFVCVRESERAATSTALLPLAPLLLLLLRTGSSCTFTRISPTFSLVPFLAAVALRTIF